MYTSLHAIDPANHVELLGANQADKNIQGSSKPCPKDDHTLKDRTLANGLLSLLPGTTHVSGEWDRVLRVFHALLRSDQSHARIASRSSFRLLEKERACERATHKKTGLAPLRTFSGLQIIKHLLSWLTPWAWHRSNRISPLEMVAGAENSGGTSASFAHEPWA